MPTIQATPSLQFVSLKVVVKTCSDVFFLDVTPRAIRTARNPNIWRAPVIVVRTYKAKGRKERRCDEHTGDKIGRWEDLLTDNVQQRTVDQYADINEGSVPSICMIGRAADEDKSLDHEARIEASRRKQNDLAANRYPPCHPRSYLSTSLGR